VADIENLETNPRPRGAERLIGQRGRWRIRSGDYRVIYEIADAQLVVLVVSVGHRREVYRDL
jgi:mRNA interferase RelE/StbE